MESENETRPLLHDFENETWRSKARKRCLRIPSEVAITGMILGLFFVVVTLLIVLENMEDTKDSDLTLDKNLLASPFKYNKKAEDMSWQDKKDNMKAKNKQNDPKWDKANKGWKKFPDISGKIDNKWDNGARKSVKDNVNILKLPAVVDDYGKDVDDSWEHLIDSGNKEAENQKTINKEGIVDGMNLLKAAKNPDQKRKQMDDHWKTLIEYERNSYLEKKDGSSTDGVQHSMSKDNVKWDNVDSGWKKLTEQGWKDQEIKEAVYKAWKEGDKLLQSATGYNNMKWKKVNDGWKKISNKS